MIGKSFNQCRSMGERAILPSDSSRSQSFPSSPIRTFTDGVPTAKRRRLESTPTSSSFSLSTPRSSSSRPEQPTLVDLHDSRTASAVRVLNIWSSLAERYNKRLDEDDVVDILTGEVIKDRGVLNDLPKRYKFGDLANKDEAIDIDQGSEAADNLTEDEGDGNGTHAFPSTDGLVASKLARVPPLRSAPSSSDADDLREFLKAEAVRRELDGGDDNSPSELDSGEDDRSSQPKVGDDDSSSGDELNLLPPRSTPSKHAVRRPDKDYSYSGSRVGRTPSARVSRVPASVPSPPLSSSPGLSSSLPPSPRLSCTPLNLTNGPLTEDRFSSPTPQQQPVASTSRKTVEEIIHEANLEVDLEFPPPQPLAPPAFLRRHRSTFVIDPSPKSKGWGKLPEGSSDIDGNDHNFPPLPPSPSPVPPTRTWARRRLKRKRIVLSESSSEEEGPKAGDLSPSSGTSGACGMATPVINVDGRTAGKSEGTRLIRTPK